MSSQVILVQALSIIRNRPPCLKSVNLLLLIDKDLPTNYTENFNKCIYNEQSLSLILVRIKDILNVVKGKLCRSNDQLI